MILNAVREAFPDDRKDYDRIMRLYNEYKGMLKYAASDVDMPEFLFRQKATDKEIY